MADQPNVVVIMTDQQRWDTLGCYGNVFTETPNVDALAEEGVRFEHAYTPYPVCTPARATTWTGVYPHRHQVIQNVYGIDNAIAEQSAVKTTVFHHFQDAGYETAYFGKWHLGEAAPDFFDHYSGFNSLGGHFTGRVWESDFKPTVQTDEMIAYFQERGGGQQERPFFAVQSYYPPHNPFLAPKEFYEPYRGKGVPFAGYYACVSALDHEVGRIRASLEAEGLAENTVIIYCSDHGEEFHYREDSGRSHKYDCHDDASRVPFIVSWPQRWSPGVRDAFIGLQDIMPTLLDLIGRGVPEELHGQSLVPLLEDASSQAGRDSFYMQNVTKETQLPQRGYRTHDWKLILTEGGKHYLHNMVEDPEEELNLYGVPRNDSQNVYRDFPDHSDRVRDLAGQMLAEARRLQDDVGIRLAQEAADS